MSGDERKMHLKTAFRRNWDVIRKRPLYEISGAVGDLGTYIPLLFALHLNGAISLSASLIFNGIANVVSGLVFGLPVPVQPMKAIAAVSLARDMSKSQTMAAGLFVAGTIGFMAITGILNWVNRLVPVPVVKGIQLGAGLSIIMTAGRFFSRLTWDGKWWDNYFWAVGFFILLIFTSLAPRAPLSRFPFALVAFITGLVVSLVVLTPAHWPKISVPKLHWHVPGPLSWTNGIIEAGLGQVPLTTLNSIVALHHLTLDLFDENSPGVRDYGLSVCLINVGCFFGAMPVCHGSGGLASQHLFGARSGGSVMVLGLLKILLGVLTGDTFARILERFPFSIIGIMVLAAGIELARAAESLNEDARDLSQEGGEQEAVVEAEGVGEHTGLLTGRVHGDLVRRDVKKERYLIMLVTASMIILFRNDGIGLMAGLIMHWAFYGDFGRFRLWRRFSRAAE